MGGDPGGSKPYLRTPSCSGFVTLNGRRCRRSGWLAQLQYSNDSGVAILKPAIPVRPRRRATSCFPVLSNEDLLEVITLPLQPTVLQAESLELFQHVLETAPPVL